ncbi:sigma-70 family RNA polymerase sigma factor [Corynebacterium sp. ES2794-CONJ1]|uniref:sigma-70 family RNA polymerase sigma factor n=1 Tax=unclassified Corynebacterium TaxID=2624378 RepID=UPI00216746CA|nr:MULTISPECIES: sigma-70 family RNA polymerase sigma factor [unclassified Corynebacterium]MCS4489566.1 sigma-70 family RNA polymerase sigma factor [Corynebacterium sp. ES2775-CONJ]MCS4491423.1 sigma-70 family RNA polymerase sigma factor [Corynebacterium sp. ES2715-CONJ3]MCS4531476.1 sigma-70 family RNA polymerase sigma factor [Corynebacterium sp. ES2730-CONJ]MCU9518864.1 sigma-70 family RNA polymerase sigma factor [Corynebacterium sp. ES2794-CONJ1]
MSDTEAALAELVPLAAAGDTRALDRVLKIVHPLVLRYTRARLTGGRQPTPEDVCQEILLAVVKSMTTYVDQGRPFMAFVYGIASHKVADAHRSYSRDLSNPTEQVPETHCDTQTPEEYALLEVGSNRVRALLDLLSEKPREILILRIFVGLSAEETAGIIGSTPGAVRVAQHRALATLRKAIEQETI